MTSAGAVAILWHRRIRSPAVSFALQLFDLVGIFVFALSGGVLAVRSLPPGPLRFGARVALLTAILVWIGAALGAWAL